MTESPMARRLREQREAAALQEPATSQVAHATIAAPATSSGTTDSTSPAPGSIAADSIFPQVATSQVAVPASPARADDAGESTAAQVAPANSHVAETHGNDGTHEEGATSQVAVIAAIGADVADTATSQVAVLKPRSQGVLVSDTDQLELEAIVARCKILGLKLRGSQYLSLVSRAGWRMLHDTVDDQAFKAAIENGRAARRAPK